MTIAVGDRLPDATFLLIGKDGPTTMTTAELTGGKTVALFAVPGAYTPGCTNTHVPSFIETAQQLSAKGVDAIACVSVNDALAMASWGKDTGATDAGIIMLADPEAKFAEAMGLTFSAPPVGLFNRSKRYSALVEDGVVKILNVENPGEMTCSLGNHLVDQI